MTFSVELIDLFKQKRGLTSDNKAASEIPGMNSGNLSKIRKGEDGRHLNEVQALFIAEQCGLNPEWVLVQLAEETAKSEKAKEIWHKLGKTIAKARNYLAIFAVAIMLNTAFSHSVPKSGKNRLNKSPIMYIMLNGKLL